MKKIINIFCGGRNSIMSLNDSTGYAIGLNSHMELNVKHQLMCNKPTPISLPDIRYVSLASSHTLLVDEDHELIIWGVKNKKTPVLTDIKILPNQTNPCLWNLKYHSVFFLFASKRIFGCSF